MPESDIESQPEARERVVDLLQGATPEARELVAEILRLEKQQIHKKLATGIPDDIADITKRLVQ